jgi:hypothetical protein
MTKDYREINESSTREEIIESLLGMAYETQSVLAFFPDIAKLLDSLLSKEDLLNLHAEVLKIYLT